MATVTEDLVANHVLVDITGGSTITRVFRVAGLVGLPHAQLIEALRDPGIPDIGDTYPNEPTLTAQRHEVRPDGPNAARIEVLYAVTNRPRGGSWNQPYPGLGNDGQDIKQVSSSLREIETAFDATGTRMVLNPPASKTNSIAYATRAKRFVPVGTVVFERIETEPQTARVRAYFGTINRVAVGPYGAKTLLFSGYDSESPDGGRTWRTTYEFQYDSGGWDHNAIWRDESGRIPDDADLQSFQILQDSLFAGLGLDFSDTQTPT